MQPADHAISVLLAHTLPPDVVLVVPGVVLGDLGVPILSGILVGFVESEPGLQVGAALRGRLEALAFLTTLEEGALLVSKCTATNSFQFDP